MADSGAIDEYDAAHGVYSDAVQASAPSDAIGPTPFANLHNPKIRSEKQAGLMGIIAGGGTPTRHPEVAQGVTPSSARKSLRGKSIKALPTQKG